MEGMKEIARAYYERTNEEEKNLPIDFFKKLDLNGDGKVSLLEFKKYFQSWQISHENVFKQLDRNGDEFLDFDEVLGFYYLHTKAKLTLACSSCIDFLFGPFFSCLLCLGKGKDTYDLCCSCYHGGKFEHEHSLNNLVDNYSLIKLLRDRTEADEQKGQGQKDIEELRKIAVAHYRASSLQIQTLASQFFDSMDADGDGQIDLPEFLAFMGQEGYTRMQNPYFFKELDTDGNGTLDFTEVVTLYYIIKSGRPFCDCCGNFIPGLYFSCVECFKNRKNSFNICLDCYRSTNCKHNHNGQAQFLDNYTLLEAKRDTNLSQATGLNQDKLTVVNPPSPKPNYSSAIVPASKTSKTKFAFKALELAINVGIASSSCTIL